MSCFGFFGLRVVFRCWFFCLRVVVRCFVFLSQSRGALLCFSASKSWFVACGFSAAQPRFGGQTVVIYWGVGRDIYAPNTTLCAKNKTGRLSRHETSITQGPGPETAIRSSELHFPVFQTKQETIRASGDLCPTYDPLRSHISQITYLTPTRSGLERRPGYGLPTSGGYHPTQNFMTSTILGVPRSPDPKLGG